MFARLPFYMIRTSAFMTQHVLVFAEINPNLIRLCAVDYCVDLGAGKAGDTDISHFIIVFSAEINFITEFGFVKRSISHNPIL